MINAVFVYIGILDQFKAGIKENIGGLALKKTTTDQLTHKTCFRPL